ncbi:MAG: hypothetical protein IKT63_01135, partial [Oscillospiraceae bacterium]|nr:hypothetical protein [Oscillospiraceae bacterium]
LLSLIILISACLATLYIYSSDYYRADETADTATESTSQVSVKITDNMAIFRPENAEAGFILYPGGKVEYTAYAPLMHKLAENNIACIITEMPFNLAVLDADAAEKAYERIADIGCWYIGGHSLGGSMAAAFLDKTDIDFDGLVLLASYSTADLTDNDIEVLSVYGSNDDVLNMESYAENFSNLPENTTEIVIDGGNHAQFGSYGKQDGDGEAEITAEEQLQFTADAIISFVKE